MSRKIQIKTDTTFKYLQVFNGILELTDKELLILSKFIDLSETTNICSADSKKKVAEDVGSILSGKYMSSSRLTSTLLHFASIRYYYTFLQ